MYIITVEGDNFAKFTDKVEYEEGRVLFECTTKKGKKQRHNVRIDKIIDIVETDGAARQGELPLGEFDPPDGFPE